MTTFASQCFMKKNNILIKLNWTHCVFLLRQRSHRQTGDPGKYSVTGGGGVGRVNNAGLKNLGICIQGREL